MSRYLWRGERNYVELNPEVQPAHIFRVRRWLTGENVCLNGGRLPERLSRLTAICICSPSLPIVTALSE